MASLLSSPYLLRPSGRRRRLASPQPVRCCVSLRRPSNSRFELSLPAIADAAKKPLSVLLFLAAASTFTFVPRPIAVAAVEAKTRNSSVLADAEASSGRSVEKDASLSRHEFSGYTDRLIETSKALLVRIKANEDIKSVKAALREVKKRKKEIRKEILEKLHSELQVLRQEKFMLMARVREVAEVMSAASGEKEKVAYGKELEQLEMEYVKLLDRVGDIEEEMDRKEVLTLSIGVRELSFVEEECELLVEQFEKRQIQGAVERKKHIPTALSKEDLQKGLVGAQSQYLEQILLPAALEFEASEDASSTTSQTFALRLSRALEESKKIQKNMETQVRRKMRKYGEEKCSVVWTSEEEVLKGYSEVELKWKFGEQEVVVPKAVSVHLYHGWKKWRDESKEKLKKDLLKDPELGKRYMDYKKEQVLLARERLVSKTWYNDAMKRWEIDPVAVPYAVSRSLVQGARIRHDWGAMYLSLKGDEKEYFVDIKEFDLLFEDFGGFDAFYVRMMASGIPTVVHLMKIPFSELDVSQQIRMIGRILFLSVLDAWELKSVINARNWVYTMIKNTTDDIMVAIVFPLIELTIPKKVRMILGMAWPEEVYQAVGTTWYLQWQSEAEMNFGSRKTDNVQWHLWFFIRSFIYCYIIFNVIRYLRRKLPRLLGYGPLRRNPNRRKFRRVVFYFKYKIFRRIRRSRKGFDPIKSAFDKMKRVKNPPIRLEEFASVDSMREEINDIVTCLRNPSAFQEKGARAPKGVLIVGDRGTGKTSLALAIAAEARVPVVQVKADQLEAGLWVGQSAANIRELFQTAREMAPVIIFVEDFDRFAGVRGQFVHTKRQDHEAFINQLLVELDGFENQDGVVLIATTRNLKQIDAALQRPGRMDRILHLQRPTQLEREKILTLAAKDTMDEELIDFVDWKKVAEKTALLRPVELKLVPVALEGSAFRSKFLDTDELMCYCSWFATFSKFVPTWLRRTTIVRSISKSLVSHLGLTLTKEDLQTVVDLMEPYGQISNGIEYLSPPLDWSMEVKFPHAVWAAGRGLMAILLPNFDIVECIWLEPMAWEGIGCTKITKAKNADSANGNIESRSYLEKKLVFCFGSYISSQLLLPFGEENFLSSNELKQAQEIATRMVIQYGWGPDDSPSIYVTNKAVGMMSMGKSNEFDVAAKVEKLYNSGYDRAKEMLQKNRKVLETIVDQLLQFENLTGEELHDIFNQHGGIREQEPFILSKDFQTELLSDICDNHDRNGAVLSLLGSAIED